MNYRYKKSNILKKKSEKNKTFTNINIIAQRNTFYQKNILLSFTQQNLIPSFIPQ